jgi:hypothetical protein
MPQGSNGAPADKQDGGRKPPGHASGRAASRERAEAAKKGWETRRRNRPSALEG